MNDDRIIELTSKIEETLGKENSAMISDTLGEILTGNTENMKAIAERDAQIKTLQAKNEKLVAANGALLMKIPVAKSEPEETSKKEEAPSNLINISKYIMSNELLQRIVKYCKENNFGPKDQEYLITDPIIEHIKAHKKIHVLPIQGEYLDGGSVEGWLHANNVVCGEK